MESMGIETREKGSQMNYKPVRLTPRGDKANFVMACTSAEIIGLSHWMEGFKCRRLDSSNAAS